jgi:hypothetical protein
MAGEEEHESNAGTTAICVSELTMNMASKNIEQCSSLAVGLHVGHEPLAMVAPLCTLSCVGVEGDRGPPELMP